MTRTASEGIDCSTSIDGACRNPTGVNNLVQLPVQ